MNNEQKQAERHAIIEGVYVVYGNTCTLIANQLADAILPKLFELHKPSETIEISGDIDTIGKCANCGVEFHIHKEVYVEPSDDLVEKIEDIMAGYETLLISDQGMNFAILRESILPASEEIASLTRQRYAEMVTKKEMFEFMQYVLIRKQGEELNPTYQKKLYEQFKSNTK